MRCAGDITMPLHGGKGGDKALVGQGGVASLARPTLSLIWTLVGFYFTVKLASVTSK